MAIAFWFAAIKKTDIFCGNIGTGEIECIETSRGWVKAMDNSFPACHGKSDVADLLWGRRHRFEPNSGRIFCCMSVVPQRRGCSGIGVHIHDIYIRHKLKNRRTMCGNRHRDMGRMVRPL